MHIISIKLLFIISIKFIRPKNCPGGIVFEEAFATDEALPEVLTYRIRLSNTLRNPAAQGHVMQLDFGWATDYVFPTSPLNYPREGESTDGGRPGENG